MSYYSIRKDEIPVGSIHFKGDFGPHCIDCRSIAQNLCDYPLSGKTCDAPLCDEHSLRMGVDKHFCTVHALEWRSKFIPDGKILFLSFKNSELI